MWSFAQSFEETDNRIRSGTLIPGASRAIRRVESNWRYEKEKDDGEIEFIPFSLPIGKRPEKGGILGHYRVVLNNEMFYTSLASERWSNSQRGGAVYQHYHSLLFFNHY
jgi:hypothetical protein